MPGPVYLAIVGTGLVGSKLISQIASLATTTSGAAALATATSASSPYPRFQIVYISSSKRSIVAPHGVDLTQWKESLAASSTAPALASIPDLVAPLLAAGGKVAVVDNTSSDEVAALYPTWLSRGLAVVTPHKKAYSSSLELYHQIVHASSSSSAPFYNESTVGAGLPIIQTLKDLVQTGDKIRKIEGVLSGTFSYIFNEYSPVSSSSTKSSFSSVVKVAKEQGYTEPHPADDLNGSDVARKLTILSRMIPELADALPKGYESVKIRSLIPEGLKDEKDGEAFVRRLPDYDAEFEKLRAQADEGGNVLRYVGVIDVATRTIEADLKPYPKSHPFATSLSGSDNIVAFHTERYDSRPLIVQGAGAGAAVTAMGVFADLFKV